MKKTTVIFDWAGTTVDYGCFAPVAAFSKVFEERGITPTSDEVREPMGMLKREHIKTMLAMPRIKEEFEKIHKRASTEKDIDEMYESFEPALFAILEDYCDLKPYVLGVIATLKDKGIKIGSTTGYTNAMMEVVTKKAKEQGYAPECWYAPDSTNNIGRPFPYMIYRNMETLHVNHVDDVVKVGDTVSDIKEAKAAGVFAIGIIEGSSVVGMTKDEYDNLSESDKLKVNEKAKKVYLDAGADAVIQDMRGLLEYV